MVLFSRNFPKGEAVLKKQLQEELFSLMRLLHFYVVNYQSSRIRGKYLKDFIVLAGLILSIYIQIIAIVLEYNVLNLLI